MPKSQQVIFEVTGTGPFPLDMLRYDGCWPARQVDVPLLRPDRDVEYGPARTIRLEGFKPAPKVERWRSFGWHVEIV